MISSYSRDDVFDVLFSLMESLKIDSLNTFGVKSMSSYQTVTTIGPIVIDVIIPPIYKSSSSS